MAHHSSFGDSPIRDEIKRMFPVKDSGEPIHTRPDLGATGKFPLGKMNRDDEGEIKLAIAHTEGKVVIDFGKPVAWIGFTPDQADEIADMLKKHADAARGL